MLQSSSEITTESASQKLLVASAAVTRLCDVHRAWVSVDAAFLSAGCEHGSGS